MKLYCSIISFLSVFTCFGQGVIDNSEATLLSPDKNLSVRFYQKGTPAGRVMYYQVSYKNKQVINESELDLQLDNNLSERAMALKVDKHVKWFENLTIVKLPDLQKIQPGFLYMEKKRV